MVVNGGRLSSNELIPSVMPSGHLDGIIRSNSAIELPSSSFESEVKRHRRLTLQPLPSSKQKDQEGKMVRPIVMITPPDGIFGAQPQIMDCPKCNALSITTVTCAETGTGAWLASLALCIALLWCICWLPFCLRRCKDVVHFCPICQQQIGRYRRFVGSGDEMD